MKFFKMFILTLGLSAVLSAGNIYNVNHYHPRSEPNGLYIVSFNYGNYFYEYRVYCPSATVREITSGTWGKSRKAYQEDRVRFRNARVVREAVDYACGP